MKNVLLYDSACPACSSVAGTAADAFGDELTTRGLRDPWVVGTIRDAGLDIPTRPALLHVDDAGVVSLFTGLRMRWQLARLLGSRRANKAMRLVVAETRARTPRPTDVRWHVSRRRLLALVGLGAGASVLGLPQSATAAPSAALATRVLSLAGVQRAVSAHGAVVPGSLLESTQQGEHVLMMRHDSGAVTFVDAAAKIDPTILTVRASTNGKARTLTFVDGTTGEPLGDLTQASAGGQIVGTPASADGPGFLRQRCFIACLAGRVSESCLQYCFNCFTSGSIFQCAAATACGGPLFVRCAKTC